VARGTSTPDPVASAYLTLRAARRDDPAALAEDVARAQQQLERAFEDQSTTKADAAKRLGVSSQTLDAWLARGLIPTVRDTAHKRERVPLGPLLALAAEVETLRNEGRQRGLLIEALSRLEAEDGRWREEIAPLLERARAPLDRSQLVSARRPDWHPED
jgi:DNA-binding transcriptional MerR regulator